MRSNGNALKAAPSDAISRDRRGKSRPVGRGMGKRRKRSKGRRKERMRKGRRRMRFIDE